MSLPGAQEALADRRRPVRKFRYPWLREKDAERRNDPAPKLRAAGILARAHEKAVLDPVDACFQALVDAQTAIGCAVTSRPNRWLSSTQAESSCGDITGSVESLRTPTKPL
jgi:hypothetical protein